ncbi:MAG TPA: peptidoglycan DD-metalloendopeptidase family protein, partial [Euzebya sp.]|nr:peptidoglycan DD-metalloendopeptidase family protein [Euzebya sp.]
MHESPGAPARRLPRLLRLTTVLLMVMVLLPGGVGRSAGAQSADQLREEQSEAEREAQAARDAQAGVAEELQDAASQREAVADDLSDATAAVDAILTDIDAVVAEQAGLRAEVRRLEGVAVVTRESLGAQIRALYMQGAADDLVLAFNVEVIDEISLRSHYLTGLSRADRGRLEALEVVTTTLAGRQDELAQVDAQLADLRAQAELRQSELDRQLLIAAGVEAGVAEELAAVEGEARQLAFAAQQASLAVEQAEEAERQAAIAAAEEAARRAEEAAAAAAAATARATQSQPQTDGSASDQASDGDDVPAAGDGGGAAPAPVSTGGMACPQDNPRSFSDTWGAPRSGGRSHQGTDIFGTRGGNVFAITSGTVTRTTSGGLAGLFLSLRGDDGHDYWYIHLQDFVASSGQRVSAGELIAHNGDSGNA